MVEGYTLGKVLYDFYTHLCFIVEGKTCVLVSTALTNALLRYFTITRALWSTYPVHVQPRNCMLLESCLNVFSMSINMFVLLVYLHAQGIDDQFCRKRRALLL